MNKKIILMLLIFLVGACAVSHVSAEEISSDSELIAAQDTEPVSIDDNADELSDTTRDLIANETSTEVTNTSTDESTPVEKTQATLKASKLTVAHKKSTKWSIKLTDSSGK